MKIIKILKISSLVYLLIPTYLFLLTWLRPEIGISACLIISVFVFNYLKNRQSDDIRRLKTPLSWLTVTLVFFLALVLNLLVGIGEFREQTVDFMANNLKYRDLVQNKWPLYYPDFKVYMCYYLGYYLPTAGLGKIVGIEYCRYISLAWSTTGAFFVFLWAITFLDKYRLSAIAVIILFSNAWLVYKVMLWLDFQTYIYPPYHVKLNDFWLMRPPFWEGFALAPQHVLPACFGACFMLEANVLKKVNLNEMLLMLLATMYWSPLASIGIFPFVLYYYFNNWSNFFTLKSIFEKIFLVLGFTPLIIYFLSTQGVNSDNTQFMWQAGVAKWYWTYLFYIVFNFLIWYFFLKQFEHPFTKMVNVALLFLTIVPLYQIGIANDLNIRASVPSMFILTVAIAYVFVETPKRKLYYWLGLAFFLVNTLPTLHQVYKSILPSKPQTTIVKADYKQFHNMLSFQQVMYGDSTAVLEYSLKNDSFFEKHLLRK